MGNHCEGICDGGDDGCSDGAGGCSGGDDGCSDGAGGGDGCNDGGSGGRGSCGCGDDDDNNGGGGGGGGGGDGCSDGYGGGGGAGGGDDDGSCGSGGGGSGGDGSGDGGRLSTIARIERRCVRRHAAEMGHIEGSLKGHTTLGNCHSMSYTRRTSDLVRTSRRLLFVTFTQKYNSI